MDGGPKLITCRVCSAIMTSLGRDTCPQCFRAEEELFQKMKKYLRENGNATIAQIADAIECTTEQVIYFINSGRLEKLGTTISRPCQMCQKPIEHGRICQECNRSIKDQVGNLAPKEKPPEKKAPEPIETEDISKLFSKKSSKDASDRKWHSGKSKKK